MADVVSHHLPNGGNVDIDHDVATTISLQDAAAGAVKYDRAQLASVTNGVSSDVQNPLAIYARHLAEAGVHLKGIDEDTGRVDWVHSTAHGSPNGAGGLGLRAKLLNGACADGVDLDIMQNNIDANGLQLHLSGPPRQPDQPKLNGHVFDAGVAGVGTAGVNGHAAVETPISHSIANGVIKPLPSRPDSSMQSVHSDGASLATASRPNAVADPASGWRVRTASIREHARNPSLGSYEAKAATTSALQQTGGAIIHGQLTYAAGQTLQAEASSRPSTAGIAPTPEIERRAGSEEAPQPSVKETATTPDLMELYASALALEAKPSFTGSSSATAQSRDAPLSTLSVSSTASADRNQTQTRLQPAALAIPNRSVDRLKQENPRPLEPLTISPASYFPQQDSATLYPAVAAVIPPTPPTSGSQGNSPVVDQGEGTSTMFLAAPKVSLKRKTPTSPRQVRTSFTDPPAGPAGMAAQPLPSATYPPLTPSSRFTAEVIAATRSSPQRTSPGRNASLSAYSDAANPAGHRKVSITSSPRRALSYLAPERSSLPDGSALSVSPGPTSPLLLASGSAGNLQLLRDPLQDDIARQADQIRRERFSKRLEQDKAHATMLAMQQEARELRESRARQRTPSMAGRATAQSAQPTAADVALQAHVSADAGEVTASPRPPPLMLPSSSQLKGKGRERGGSVSFLGHDRDDILPDSPKSGRSMGWASPTAGEKSLLRDGPSALGNVPDRATVHRSKSTGGFGNPDRVLVGKLIGEDHVNYVLMYNMLTGIRIGVSRCEAKIKRPLTDADYKAQHKFSFDIIGNELTPSARYDFKFKDYAPWVFRELREHFHLDPADYLLSLTAKYILSELGSPGKSGSFFYFSRDYRFIIKTISHTEHRFLRKILKEYHRHVLDNPHTLLSRFYGLHRVKLPRGRKIHFVIMNNLFPPHKDVHEKYDLKGSSVGRVYPEDKALNNPGAILKDLNWIRRNRQIELGPYKRNMLHEQLQRDVALLKRCNIMDYSLLIGTHDMGLGNSEKLRDGMLTVFQPDTAGKLRRRPTQRGDFERMAPSSTGSDLRKAIQRADPTALPHDGTALPDKERSEKRYFAFYQDEGGLRATDESDRNLNTIYYFGVIDILTPYNWYKRVEHLWRSMQYDKHRISAVPPREYGDRFLGFMASIVRNGDQSRRPKME